MLDCVVDCCDVGLSRTDCYWIGQPNQFFKFSINEWVSEWVSEWVNEWMNEFQRVNEWWDREFSREEGKDQVIRQSINQVFPNMVQFAEFDHIILEYPLTSLEQQYSRIVPALKMNYGKIKKEMKIYSNWSWMSFLWTSYSSLISWYWLNKLFVNVHEESMVTQAEIAVKFSSNNHKLGLRSTIHIISEIEWLELNKV